MSAIYHTTNPWLLLPVLPSPAFFITGFSMHLIRNKNHMPYLHTPRILAPPLLHIPRLCHAVPVCLVALFISRFYFPLPTPIIRRDRRKVHIQPIARHTSRRQRGECGD